MRRIGRAVAPRGSRGIAVSMALVALLCGGAAAAQDPPGRTELQRTDLSGAHGMEVITSLVELKAGEGIELHVHHGVETAYVLQGAMIQAPGQAPRMLATGLSLVNQRGVPHGAFRVVGEGPLRLLTVHVVDKGQPLYDAPP